MLQNTVYDRLLTASLTLKGNVNYFIQSRPFLTSNPQSKDFPDSRYFLFVVSILMSGVKVVLISPPLSTTNVVQCLSVVVLRDPVS